ncbi:VOC family protein [Shinella zoogloeoides]|uniref:VOC family protein n=1 Tax=Shinella zoogloeoides TaxID=352475 RepID=UPI00273F728C|nr:VOC family protein [Shinella zoogloeoides]WLR92238.1 VOC family protein [Shinella zoogloeoides]
MAFTNVPPLQPHICVKGGQEAIAFYERALGAENTFHQLAEDGRRVMHANLAIYGGEVMLHDEFPEFDMSVSAPTTLGGASVAISINLSDSGAVDAAYAKAVEAGAHGLMPPADVFWGARYARITDPFGHVWAFNAPLEQK